MFHHQQCPRSGVPAAVSRPRRLRRWKRSEVQSPQVTRLFSSCSRSPRSSRHQGSRLSRCANRCLLSRPRRTSQIGLNAYPSLRFDVYFLKVQAAVFCCRPTENEPAPRAVPLHPLAFADASRRSLRSIQADLEAFRLRFGVRPNAFSNALEGSSHRLAWCRNLT